MFSLVLHDIHTSIRHGDCCTTLLGLLPLPPDLCTDQGRGPHMDAEHHHSSKPDCHTWVRGLYILVTTQKVLKVHSDNLPRDT